MLAGLIIKEIMLLTMLVQTNRVLVKYYETFSFDSRLLWNYLQLMVCFTFGP